MPETHPAVEPGVFDALRGGDLASMERLFRARFSDLVKEATLEPGDAAAAPHVVERAFTRLWADRATFDSPAALESSLHRVVHDAAVRERSRRAAIARLEENVHAKVTADAAAPSVDESWARVENAVRRPAADVRAVAHDQAVHSRHSTAEHLAGLSKKRAIDWRVVGGSLVAIAVIVGGFTLLGRGAADGVVLGAIGAPDAKRIETRPAQRGNSRLADGTEYTIGPESRLRLPTAFGRDMRAVGLEGTATFTAGAGLDEPLDVRAKNVSVTSPGGTFTVRAYPEDSSVAVLARAGTVSVRAEGETRTLAPGTGVSVASNGTMTPLVSPALEEAVGWSDGRLVFVNRPLRQVLPELKRWYLLDLYIQDSTLPARQVDSMSAGLESSREAIAALERAANVKLTFQGKTMVLQDARAGGRR